MDYPIVSISFGGGGGGLESVESILEPWGWAHASFFLVAATNAEAQQMRDRLRHVEERSLVWGFRVSCFFLGVLGGVTDTVFVH